MAVRVISPGDEPLGFGFIPPEYLPPGRDEYWLRFAQNPAADYRPLTSGEIGILESRGNRADDWRHVTVREGFDPSRVENSRFYGLNRLGILDGSLLKYHDLKLPCGIYDCTLVSCDIGDRSALHRIGMLSHYIIGEECLLFCLDEMGATNHSKFGNGLIKEGEPEEVRVRLETANENGGRAVLPFEGMLPADAWLWSSFRKKEVIQQCFLRWTDALSPRERGMYGRVGNRSVIKSCRIIKDVKIGPGSYIKGANKLKNLTLAGTEESPIQIGEGVELVNGIIHRGAKIFYGVKAIRFVLGEGSQLKYGARLINSILGANSTISCCEVLNALIFPFHEQHHNNSFLIAATIKGQSNMAAGATVGSNHNSRGADGEIIAERGFWPGLNVSLKHNSRFAPFALIAKGSYPAELNLELPFCLVSNDPSESALVLMPGYWFFYNLYALARNCWKFAKRDRRLDKSLPLEFDYLAPDTADALLKGRELLESWCGRDSLDDGRYDPESIVLREHSLERGKRPARIIRPARAWKLYGELLDHYLAVNLIHNRSFFSNYADLEAFWTKDEPLAWYNLGGQMVCEDDLSEMERDMAAPAGKPGRLDSWEALHDRYRQWGARYAAKKMGHSLACFQKKEGGRPLSMALIEELTNRALEREREFLHSARRSREKDFSDPFRKMVYRDEEEMAAVLGNPGDDPFLKEKEASLSSLAIGAEEFLQTIRR